MDQFLDNPIEQKVSEQNLFRRSRPETSLKFDYEVNNIELAEKDGEIIAYDRKSKETINFDLSDSITNITPDGIAKRKTDHVYKANCFKRLVSKKKHRIQNEYFDLDMAYITPRILAMGYPSTGCESLYRNSLKDAMFFLNRYHREYKVYNLCLENGRIYHKEVFQGKKVGLFPFMDHQPCPIKLMLEMCTDVCLYLIRNKDGVAVIHCKAGKGRTGMMIICYLIFSGLCEDSNSAIKHYANMRCINHKGVTIPSQIRYIQYFETFLSTNFKKPYYKMIPQIMEYHITTRVVNTLRNYLQENDYFYTENKFILKHLRIGPFTKNKQYEVKLASLINKNIRFPNSNHSVVSDNNGHYYYEMEFNSNSLFNYDIKLECSAFKFKFYCWNNLYFTTLENISQYIMKNDLISKTALLSNKVDSIITNSPPKDCIINTNMIQSDESNVSKSSNFADMMKKVEEFENSDPKNESVSSSIVMSEVPAFSLGTNHSSHALVEEEICIEMTEKKPEEPPKPKKKKRHLVRERSSIGKLIDMLKEDKDLIQFIHGINSYSAQLNIEQFDMTNQKIILDKSKLDKFVDSFGVIGENFQVEYTYSLEQGQ